MCIRPTHLTTPKQRGTDLKNASSDDDYLANDGNSSRATVVILLCDFASPCAPLPVS